MRPRFERALGDYSDIAKEEQQEDRAPEEVERFVHVLDWHLERAAEASATSKEVQREVYTIQQRKQEVMAGLKETLRRLDDPQAEWEVPEGARVVTREGAHYVWVDERGKRYEVTLGTLITDGEWGLTYHLDPATAPRADRKRYFVADARRQIADLLDEQIATEEVRTKSSGAARASWGIILRHRLIQNGGEIVQQDAGVVAELTMQGVLERAVIDDGVEIRVQRADVFQDAEQKIDFIIQRQRHHRGASVEGDTQLSRVGVQFTIATASTLRKKRNRFAQVKEDVLPELREHERIDDMVLVRFNIPNVVQQYHAWVRMGRPPGGPLYGWAQKEAGTLLSGFLAGMFSAGELQQVWKNLRVPESREQSKGQVYQKERERSAAPFSLHPDRAAQLLAACDRWQEFHVDKRHVLRELIAQFLAAAPNADAHLARALGYSRATVRNNIAKHTASLPLSPVKLLAIGTTVRNLIEQAMQAPAAEGTAPLGEDAPGPPVDVAA